MAKRKAAAVADLLEIPAFLKRERTDESRLLVDRIINQRDRQLVMPKGETDMAKKQKEAESQDIKTQDPALPVKMQFSPEKGPKVVKDFDNLEQFIEWFDPAIHIVTGSDADSALTLIEVKEKPTPLGRKLAKGDPKLAGVNAVEGAIPPSPGQKATGGRGAVIKKDGGGRGGARPGAVRHGCKVGDKGPYGSVYKAFLDLSLSIPAHTKFRALLKVAPGGKLTYEEGGKKYPFELVELGKA